MSSRNFSYHKLQNEVFTFKHLQMDEYKRKQANHDDLQSQVCMPGTVPKSMRNDMYIYTYV